MQAQSHEEESSIDISASQSKGKMRSTSPIRGPQEDAASSGESSRIAPGRQRQPTAIPLAEANMEDFSTMDDTDISVSTAATANAWLIQLLKSSTALSKRWNMLMDCWDDDDIEPQIALSIARSALEKFQDEAIKKEWQDIPAVIKATLFARKTSSQRGRSLSNRWRRTFELKSWSDTKAVSHKIMLPISSTPFYVLRLLVHRPPQIDRLGLRGENQELYDQLMGAATRPYLGNARAAFCSRLELLENEIADSNANTVTSVYGRIVPMVQSRGSGKSRLLQELSWFELQEMMVVTVTIRLGTYRSFPPADTQALQFTLDEEEPDALVHLVAAFCESISLQLDALGPAEIQEWIRKLGMPTSPQRDWVWALARDYTFDAVGPKDIYSVMEGLLGTLQSAKAAPSMHLVVAIDEAQIAHSKHLEALRRCWAPKREPSGSLTRPMPQRVFLCLAGTTNQLDTLVPLPGSSGSGRLSGGQLYLPRPFMALDIRDIPTGTTDQAEVFSNWHQKGRQVWAALSKDQCQSFVKDLFPSFDRSNLTESDVIGTLYQRVSFDLLGPGQGSGDYKVMQRIRDLQVDQLDTKLLWLCHESSRTRNFETSTLSEPIPSFWLGFVISRVMRGWSRVIDGLAGIIYSLKTWSIDAGELGELVAQVILIVACDHIRFSALTGGVDADRAGSLVAIGQTDFLRKLVATDWHLQLDRDVEVGGVLSFVRFVTVSRTFRKVSQEDLAYLWFRGEAIKGCKGQSGWDLMLPVKFPSYYTVLTVQVKNQVKGPEWTGSEINQTSFPTVEGASDKQRIVLYMELNGTRCKEGTNRTQVFALADLNRKTRSDNVKPMDLVIANCGKSCSNSMVGARTFPVLADEHGLADAVANLITTPVVEEAQSEPELEILRRAKTRSSLQP
ncbi:unnamed protein product [Sympodiomycopsis kandeliae]